MTAAPRSQPKIARLIGCAGALLTSSLVVIPALVAAYYIIWEGLK